MVVNQENYYDLWKEKINGASVAQIKRYRERFKERLTWGTGKQKFETKMLLCYTKKVIRERNRMIFNGAKQNFHKIFMQVAAEELSPVIFERLKNRAMEIIEKG